MNCGANAVIPFAASAGTPGIAYRTSVIGTHPMLSAPHFTSTDGDKTRQLGDRLMADVTEPGTVTHGPSLTQTTRRNRPAMLPTTRTATRTPAPIRNPR